MDLFKSVKILVNHPIKTIFAKLIESEVNKKFTEAVDRDREDLGWDRITDIRRTRDLPSIKQDKMIKVVDWLKQRNPIAKKMITLTTDFVMGDGIKFVAENKEVQKVLDDFWKNNQWPLKQFQRVEELGQYGEQIYNTSVHKETGAVTIASFDPAGVKSISVVKKNREQLDEIKPKTTKDDVKFKIIRIADGLGTIDDKDKDRTKKDQTESGMMIGDTFFFAVNKSTFATRGTSDILSVADWLDKYDKTLYTMTERIAFLLSFIWHITIEGADINQLKKKLNDIKSSPPKAGGYRITNEKEKWEAIAPDLSGRDFTDFIKNIQAVLAGGSGFPIHWLFGVGESVNKASATDMGVPTYRQLKRRQTFVKQMISFMFEYVIQMAISHGTLKVGLEETTFNIIMPDPSKKEAKDIAANLKNIVDPLVLAKTNQLLSEETVQQVLTMLVGELGVDIKTEDENDKIVKESLSPDKVYDALDRIVKKVMKDKNAG